MSNERKVRARTWLRPGVARIDALRLSNFRLFDNTRFELGESTVLVGRNGAGKSTLIDAFELIRDALSDSLENALERHGGIGAIVGQGGAARGFSLAVSLTLFEDWVLDIAKQMGVEMPKLSLPRSSAPELRMVYGFSVDRRRGGTGFAVSGEVIAAPVHGTYFERDGRVGPAPAFAREALALPVLADRDPIARAILNVLRDGIRAYCLSPMAIRVEPQVGQGSALLYDGRNVGDMLKRLQTNKEDMSWVVRHLEGTTPGIVGLEASAAAGRRIVRFVQKGPGETRRKFGIHDMSDGTLRCLGILLALRQTPQPSLVCIDEIEDSIHPAALSVLLDAVASSTERCQVVLTSHSPEALSHPFVTAEDVRVVEWREGKSDVYRLSRGAAEASHPPRSVGRLLRTNSLFTADEPEQITGGIFEA